MGNDGLEAEMRSEIILNKANSGNIAKWVNIYSHDTVIDNIIAILYECEMCAV